MAALSAGSDDAPRLFEKAAEWLGGRPRPRHAVPVSGGGDRRAAKAGRNRGGAAEGVAAGSGRLVEAASSRRAQRSASRAGRRKLRNRAQEMLLAIFETGEPEVRNAALRALGRGLPPERRGRALKKATELAAMRKPMRDCAPTRSACFALADPDRMRRLFRSLIDPHQPEPVQSAARSRVRQRVRRRGGGVPVEELAP